MKKILLAYSGGLDTSCILTWLKEKYGVPIVAYCANVGQLDQLGEVEEKALRTGADKYILEDLTHDFVENYVFQSVKANGVYEGTYLMGTSLAQTLHCPGYGHRRSQRRLRCDRARGHWQRQRSSSF